MVAREAIIYTLGIDVGTSGTRALIIDEQGRVVASATEEHAPFASPEIGWAEQHPEDWWRACCVAVPQAGCYKEILNTDSSHYGGSNIGNQ